MSSSLLSFTLPYLLTKNLLMPYYIPDECDEQVLNVTYGEMKALWWDGKPEGIVNQEC